MVPFLRKKGGRRFSRSAGNLRINLARREIERFGQLSSSRTREKSKRVTYMKQGSKLRRQIDITTVRCLTPLYITLLLLHTHLGWGGSYHVGIDIGRVQILICHTRRSRKVLHLSLGGGRKKKVLAAESWWWRNLLDHLPVRDWRMYLGWQVRIRKLWITFRRWGKRIASGWAPRGLFRNGSIKWLSRREGSKRCWAGIDMTIELLVFGDRRWRATLPIARDERLGRRWSARISSRGWRRWWRKRFVNYLRRWC